MREYVVKVKGMSCQHCVRAVTKALQEIEGVRGVTVSLDRGEAVVVTEGTLDRNTVRSTLKRAGHETEDIVSRED